MSTSPESYNEIELTAAEWLSRQDSGLTVAEQAELAEWLAASSKHAEAFRVLAGAWRRLDVVRGGPRLDLVQAAKPRNPAGLVRFPRTVVVALAASIAIAAIGWWLRPTPGDSPYATAAITQAGVTRSLSLPDGSVVQLNAESAVEVGYHAAGRHVRLVRGEAHFTVAKHKSLPFIVSVGQVAVRAVGTAFNVRLTPVSVEVLVTEGKVSVDDANQGRSLLVGVQALDREDAVLAAGERVVVPLSLAQPTPAAVTAVPAAEIRQTLAWKEPRLEFDTVPLKTIVAEFNRHNQHRLVIADATLEGLRFGGTFPANDYEGLVRLLVHNYGVVAETYGDQTNLRLAPAK